MAKRKKTKPADPARNAQREAEKDMHDDPEFSEGDPTDDLDEGELAQRDNSGEEGFDALEKQRRRDHHTGKGSEK